MQAAPVASRLFHYLASAYTTAKLYGYRHKLSLQEAERICETLKQNKGQSVELEITPEGAFANNQPVDTSIPSLAKLIQQLQAREVGLIVFQPNLEIAEILSLFEFLDTPADQIRYKGAAKAWPRDKINHIQPIFAQYKRVKETERVVTTKELSQLVSDQKMATNFRQFLSGQPQKLNPADQQNIQLLLRETKKIAQYLVERAKTETAHDSPSQKEQSFASTLMNLLKLVNQYFLQNAQSEKRLRSNRKKIQNLSETVTQLATPEMRPENRALLQKQITYLSFQAVQTLEIKGLLTTYQRRKKSLDRIEHQLEELLKKVDPTEVCAELSKIQPPRVEIFKKCKLI